MSGLRRDLATPLWRNLSAVGAEGQQTLRRAAARAFALSRCEPDSEAGDDTAGRLWVKALEGRGSLREERQSITSLLRVGSWKTG
jgi:hypothetical protein